MRLIDKLGIQSYCFRGFPEMKVLIDSLRKVDLDHVEIWPGHIDFAGKSGIVDEKVGALREAGIHISSYGAVLIKPDNNDNVRAHLGVCRLSGIQAITVLTSAECAESCDMFGQEYGVKIALHNHGSHMQLGRSEDIERFLNKTSPTVGVCLDTAWLLQVNEDPIAFIDRFHERLYGVHLKDFTFDAEGNPTDVLIGDGGVDLQAVFRSLKRYDFDGYLSIENEGNQQDPFDETSACVLRAREAWAAVENDGNADTSAKRNGGC